MEKRSFLGNWSAHHLRGTDDGRVHLTGRSPENLAELRAAAMDAGFALFEVDTSRARTESDLLHDFAIAMSFPSYFGNNWDAFEECVNDLAWRPAAGYVVILRDADSMIRGMSGEAQMVVSILADAVRKWSSQGTNFHVVLTGHLSTLERAMESIARDSPVILCVHTGEADPS